jgi:hypothetical protein
MLCDNCGNAQEMSLQRKQNKCDGFMWRCKPGRSTFKSIFYGSFLSSFKLCFRDIFMIVYKYKKKDEFLDNANRVDVIRTTVRIFIEKVSNLIINDVESSTDKLKGFDSNEQQKMVEID